VIVPPTSRPANRSSAVNRTCSGQPVKVGRWIDSSTLESAVFTPWPPGPDEREKFQPSAFAGTVNDGPTTRSPNGFPWAGITGSWSETSRSANAGQLAAGRARALATGSASIRPVLTSAGRQGGGRHVVPPDDDQFRLRRLEVGCGRQANLTRAQRGSGGHLRRAGCHQGAQRPFGRLLTRWTSGPSRHLSRCAATGRCSITGPVPAEGRRIVALTGRVTLRRGMAVHGGAGLMLGGAGRRTVGMPGVVDGGRDD